MATGSEYNPKQGQLYDFEPASCSRYIRYPTIKDWEIRDSSGGWRQLREGDLRLATGEAVDIRRPPYNDGDVEEEVPASRGDGVHRDNFECGNRKLRAILRKLRNVIKQGNIDQDPHAAPDVTYVNCVAIAVCEVIKFLQEKQGDNTG